MNTQMQHKNNAKAINKGLIFLKSTVLALFIILVVLSISLVMFKNKKNQSKNSAIDACHKPKSIIVSNEIEKIEGQGKVLNVLTKRDVKNNSQELIRIDAACGNEISRIHFKIKQ